MTLQVGAIATAGIGFVSSAVLARTLGSAEYGLYALALSVISMTLLLTDLGQGLSAVTLWAEALAQGSLVRAAAVGGYVLRTSLASSGLVFVAGFLAAPLFAASLYHQPRLAPLLVALLAAGLFSIGLRVVAIALQVTRRMRLLVGLETGDLALRATLSVAAALAGFGAAGVVGGQALGGLVIAVLALALYQWVGRQPPQLPALGEMGRLALAGSVPMRRMLGFGLSIVLERDLRIVASTAPMLLLGLMAPTSEIGHLRIALSYMALPSLLYDPLARVLMVTFPELRLRDSGALGPAYWRSVAISSVGILVLALALALIAPWAIPLVYGQEYRESAALAPVLGFAAAAGAMNAVSIPMLRSVNRVLPAVWLGGGALLISALPLVWLIVRYGALGAAAAYALGTLLLALTSQWVAWRALRHPPPAAGSTSAKG